MGEARDAEGDWESGSAEDTERQRLRVNQSVCLPHTPLLLSLHCGGDQALKSLCPLRQPPGPSSSFLCCLSSSQTDLCCTVQPVGISGAQR